MTATRTIESAVRQLRRKLDAVRERELAVALKRLPDLTPAQRAAVERLSRALLTAFVHGPSVRLRAVAGEDRAGCIVGDARYLFAIEDRAQPRRASEGPAPGDDARAA